MCSAEDAHAVALTCIKVVTWSTSLTWQLLDEAGCSHVRIFGGGGGTITPPEIRELHNNGISRIYSPDDGRKMGLMGMIHDLMGTASEVDLISEGRLSTLNQPITPDDWQRLACC